MGKARPSRKFWGYTRGGRNKRLQVPSWRIASVLSGGKKRRRANTVISLPVRKGRTSGMVGPHNKKLVKFQLSWSLDSQGNRYNDAILDEMYLRLLKKEFKVGSGCTHKGEYIPKLHERLELLREVEDGKSLPFTKQKLLINGKLESLLRQAGFIDDYWKQGNKKNYMSYSLVLSPTKEMKEFLVSHLRRLESHHAEFKQLRPQERASFLGWINSQLDERAPHSYKKIKLEEQKKNEASETIAQLKKACKKFSSQKSTPAALQNPPSSTFRFSLPPSLPKLEPEPPTAPPPFVRRYTLARSKTEEAFEQFMSGGCSPRTTQDMIVDSPSATIDVTIPPISPTVSIKSESSSNSFRFDDTNNPYDALFPSVNLFDTQSQNPMGSRDAFAPFSTDDIDSFFFNKDPSYDSDDSTVVDFGDDSTPVGEMMDIDGEDDGPITPTSGSYLNNDPSEEISSFGNIPLVDGSWRDAYGTFISIKDGEVHYRNADNSEESINFTIRGNGENGESGFFMKMEVSGKTFVGRINDNLDEISWNDGDVWKSIKLPVGRGKGNARCNLCGNLFRTIGNSFGCPCQRFAPLNR